MPAFVPPEAWTIRPEKYALIAEPLRTMMRELVNECLTTGYDRAIHDIAHRLERAAPEVHGHDAGEALQFTAETLREIPNPYNPERGIAPWNR